MSTVEVIKNRDDNRIRELRSFDFAALARSGGMRRETPETAPEVPAVIACIRVIAESVGSLPLHIYRMDSNGAKVLATDSPLYRLMRYAPNDEQTSLELREQLCMLYLLYGDAYCELVRNDRGVITAMMPLHPSRMTTERLTDGTLRYIYREPNGRQTIYNQRQLWHLRMPTLDGVHGLSLPTLVRDAIAHARALESYGLTYFANGARPGVVLQSDNPIPPEAAERMREQWERMHRGSDRAHRTAVLPNGLKVHELSGSNESSQFIDARKMAVVEICRAFRVPPHLVQSLDGATYSNIEHQSREFLTYTLLPHLRRIEDSIARDLIDDPTLFAEHDVHAFMRGDSAARAAWYQQALNSGIMSINEVRAAEGMNPIGPEGDERFLQVNMTTLRRIVAGESSDGA
jgi:HK97 family phage portal protein